jgi:putative spermidine/putrescine transport system permease protein
MRGRAAYRTALRSSLLLPGAFLIFGLFVVPLLLIALRSLHLYQPLSGESGDAYTLQNYVTFFSSTRYVDILVRTFKLAAIATVACLVLAYPVAYYIARQRGRKQVYLLLGVLSPLLVFVIVRTVGWTLILGNNGLVNNLLQGLHITQEPIRLIGTDLAITVGLVHVYIPYMILAIYTSVQNLDERLVLAAQSLGATPRSAFFRVVVPMTVPGIASGCLLVFTLSASSFSTPAILGGQRAQVMSYLIYKQIFALQDWPFASAASVILLMLVGALMLGYLWFTEGRRYRLVFG